MAFSSDNRAQAIQIGAVLIFGILIIFFSLYQAFVVPAQNKEIDVNHHQEVERDMVDLRAEILQAKTTGEDRFTTVTLGTSYPSRVIAQNPPDPSGSLRTTDNRTLAVDVDGDGNNDLPDLYDKFEPANKFIEYVPTYSEFENPGTIRYENTVTYQDFGSKNLPLTNQRLLRDDTISLIPIHRDYQASGRQTASIEPVPGILETTDVEDPTVTLGTNLTEDDWEDLLSEQIENNDNLSAADITVDENAGELTLNLQGTYKLEYAPVGLDRSPRGGSRGDAILEINPASPGDIELVGANWRSKDNTVTLTFENTVEENNSFARGRIPFYDSDGDVTVEAVRTDNDGYSSNRAVNAPWAVPDEFRDIDPNIELQGKSETKVRVQFGGVNINENQDWFIIEFKLESGQVATYFNGGSFGG